MLIDLFITFFKIGLFTFGGGYGMISLVKDECIEKKKWVNDEEFVNLIAVAESTPGPIAVNMATYVGYRKAKVIGAVTSTIAVVLPSLIIIYIISQFLRDFLNNKIIADAFFGIRIAVSLVIFRTAYNLIKEEYKTSVHKVMTLVLFFVYTLILFSAELFGLKISSVIMILFAIILGIVLNFFVIKESK